MSGTPTQRCTRWFALCLLASAGFTAVAQSPSKVSIQSIDHVALGANSVRITLTLDGKAPEPRSFFVEQPARLSVDLADIGIGNVDRVRRINIGGTRSLALAQASDRTRLVVEMTQPLPHEVRSDGNRILILINADERLADAAAAAERAPAPPIQAPTPEPAASSPSATSAPAPARTAQRPTRSQGNVDGPMIRNVDFRRAEDGSGRVTLQLARAGVRVDVSERGGSIVARLPDASAAAERYQRYDVVDFATPVKQMELRRDGSASELIVTPLDNAEYEQIAYQADDTFVIELKPLTAEAIRERAQAEPTYSGERVTLSFQNVEVRSLLQIIAEVADVNLVVSDSVSGAMTLRLDNVPWDQALDIVLRQRGLGMEQQGNVMLVAPNEEIARRAAQAQDARLARADLAPLRTEVIQVNFSNASELAEIIRQASEQRNRGGAGGAGSNQRTVSGLLSDRGQITVDGRTNTLIVQEARDNLDEIRRLVTRLDVPVRQVLIESRIAIVNDDFQKDIGVQAGFTSIGTSGNSTIGISGTGAGAADVATGGGIPAIGNRLGVRLPVASPAGSFGLAVLGTDFLVDLELSAMQMEGRGELISTPRVVTADRSEAAIRQGLQVPISTRSQGDADTTTTEFVDALLELRVTPEITPNDGVFLNLFVTRNEPDFTRVNADGNPAIATREVSTRVLVQTGETLVLGGAYESEQTNNATKVPLLGDIPIIGRLFRRNSDRSSQRELLVFVTPKILAEGLSIGSK